LYFIYLKYVQPNEGKTKRDSDTQKEKREGRGV